MQAAVFKTVDGALHVPWWVRLPCTLAVSRSAARDELTEELEGPATDLAADVEPGRTSAIAALRYRDFRLFWFGLLVSNVGTWMQMFGQGYLVVLLAVRDGVPQLAPLYLGLVGLARAIPGLTLGLFGGALADRTDRRRLLLVTQSAAAVTAAILATLAITDRINIVEILLLGALNSTIFAFDAPTRQSMVPRLVPERDLMSAIGLNSAAFNGPQIIGPVIGGLIFAPFAATPTFGAGLLFYINAISYLAVVVALLRMRPVPIIGKSGEVSMLDSIREGLAYIRQDVVVRWIVILAAATALFARPYLQLLPAVARTTSCRSARSSSRGCSRPRVSAPSVARWRHPRWAGCAAEARCSSARPSRSGSSSSGSRCSARSSCRCRSWCCSGSRRWCSSGWPTASCRRARPITCAAGS